MPDSDEDKFLLEGNELAVRGGLDAEDEKALSWALERLLGGVHEQVVINLSDVHNMTSACIPPIAAAMKEARLKGLDVTVWANAEVAFLLDVAGLRTLGEIRLAIE